MKYYKVPKDIALRGGFDEILRQEVDGFLMLSESDLRMVSLTTEEKVLALGIEEVTEDDLEKDTPIEEDLKDEEDE